MPNTHDLDPTRKDVSPRAKAIAAVAALAISAGALGLISAKEPKADPLQAGGNKIDYPEPGGAIMPDGTTTDGTVLGNGYPTPETPQATPGAQPPAQE